MADESARAVRIFISYAKKDARYLRELEHEVLDALAVPSEVTVRPVDDPPSTSAPDHDLASATLVLVLVTRNYLEAVSAGQLATLMAIAGRWNRVVVPVIFERCDWRSTALAKYLPLPDYGRPISDDFAEGWVSVRMGIGRLVPLPAAQLRVRFPDPPNAVEPPRKSHTRGRRVTDYRFSTEAARVVAGAEFVQLHEELLTSEALAFAVLVHALESAKTTRFFVDVLQKVDPPEGFRRPVFGDEIARVGIRTRYLTANATEVLDLALRAAAATTGGNVISLRHLMYGLTQPIAGSGKDELFTNLYLTVDALSGLYFDYLRKSLPRPDELVAWERLMRPASPYPAAGSYAPSFASDQNATVDLLGFGKDARALASLIASRETRPPLAIGLFGDWGSGKSFFMRMIRERVADLAQRASNAVKDKQSPAFYGNVVQIEFNAWHYVEGNLWASLVEHIFSNLRLHPNDSDEDLEKRRAELLKMLEVEREQQQAAAAAKDTATEVAKKAREARQQKIEERVKLQLAKNNDWAKAFKEDEDLANAGLTEDTLKTLGRIRDRGKLWWITAGRIVAAIKHLRGAKGRTLLFAFGVVLVTLGLPAAVWWLANEIGIGYVKTFVAASVPMAWALVSWLSPWVARAGEIAKLVEHKHRELELLREQHAIAIDQEIAALSRGVEQAEANALQAAERIDSIRKEMESLSTASIFSSFLEERAASSDYRRHLGVLANIRRDFERMARLLEKQQRDPNQTPVIERIVLYVDDLDRCPASRVVQVLQAIHLLLAFPIFVVVVGVDARWIARALQTEYDTLLGHADDGFGESLGAEATAHDYLQKIFQVPFWIRSMNATACANFMAGLAAPVFVEGEPTTYVSNTAEDSWGQTAPLMEHGDVPNAAPQPRAEADDDLNPLALHTLPEEVELRNALTPLLGRSPRAVKRFVNCYQLIKITVEPPELGAFLTDASAPLHFRSVMFLLAVVTGTPEFGEKLLDVLDQLGDPLPSDVQTLLLMLEKEFGGSFVSERSRAGNMLLELAKKDAGAWHPGALQNAAHVVRRYSFRAGYAAAREPERKNSTTQINIASTEITPPAATSGLE